MPSTAVQFRSATAADLPVLNTLIEQAVMTWDLPERVKRLSLSSYRYNDIDLQSLNIILAEQHGEIVGVAALEPQTGGASLAGKSVLLVHGLYVRPDRHRQGIGRQLLMKAEEVARERGVEALLVRAQRGAGNFFHAAGFQPLGADNPDRDYAGRFWKPVD